MLGGYTGRGDLRGEVSTLYRYDPRRNRWSRLPERADEARGAGGRRDRRQALRGRRSEHRAGRAARRSRSTTSRAGAGRAARTWPIAREHLAGRRRGRRVLRARRPRGRAGQLQGRRALPAPSAAAGSGCPTCASRAAASRAATVGRPRRRGRRRGGERARSARSRRTTRERAAGPACRTCAPRATASASCRAAAASTRSRAARSPGFHFSNAIEALDLRRLAVGGQLARASPARDVAVGSSISARLPATSVFSAQQLPGDREVVRAADGQRRREPPVLDVPGGELAVLAAARATRSRPSRSPDRRTPCSSSRRGRTRSRARRRTACCLPSMLSAAYLPWLKATSQCSIRSRRPCTTLSYSAMSPAAKMPGHARLEEPVGEHAAVGLEPGLLGEVDAPGGRRRRSRRSRTRSRAPTSSRPCSTRPPSPSKRSSSCDAVHLHAVLGRARPGRSGRPRRRRSARA